MKNFRMKAALSGSGMRLLSDLSAYVSIILLMDIGNQYAGVVSFSGRSEGNWLISCALLATFSALTLVGYASRSPGRNPAEDGVALRLDANARPEANWK